MAQLAGELGVSKGLLYHYYASKEALLFDIVQNHLTALVEVVEEADDPALDPGSTAGSAGRRPARSLSRCRCRAPGPGRGHAAPARRGSGEAEGTGAPAGRHLRRGHARSGPGALRGQAADQAGHHEPLRHDELGLYVVPRRRPGQPRRLCAAGDAATGERGAGAEGAARAARQAAFKSAQSSRYANALVAVTATLASPFARISTRV
jgi:AcrR family transcriptional regulator